MLTEPNLKPFNILCGNHIRLQNLIENRFGKETCTRTNKLKWRLQCVYVMHVVQRAHASDKFSLLSFLWKSECDVEDPRLHVLNTADDVIKCHCILDRLAYSWRACHSKKHLPQWRPSRTHPFELFAVWSTGRNWPGVVLNVEDGKEDAKKTNQ
jgi:hypothetical protein